MKKITIFEAPTTKTQNMEINQLIYNAKNQAIIKSKGYNISGICAPWVVHIR